MPLVSCEDYTNVLNAVRIDDPAIHYFSFKIKITSNRKIGLLLALAHCDHFYLGLHRNVTDVDLKRGYFQSIQRSILVFHPVYGDDAQMKRQTFLWVYLEHDFSPREWN